MEKSVFFTYMYARRPLRSDHPVYKIHRRGIRNKAYNSLVLSP